MRMSRRPRSLATAGMHRGSQFFCRTVCPLTTTRLSTIGTISRMLRIGACLWPKKNASKPPAAVEAAIKREWRELQVKAAEKKRAARDVAQRHGYDVDAERVPTRMAEQPRSVPEAAHDSGTASAAAPPSDSSPTARDKRAAARASRDGDDVAPPPAKRSKLHDVDGTATESAYRPGRFASAPIDDIPCAECGDHRPHPNNAIICCDVCNKAFHQECFKISVLPDADADWLCHNCLEPGMRICVFSPRQTMARWRCSSTAASRARHRGGV